MIGNRRTTWRISMCAQSYGVYLCLSHFQLQFILGNIIHETYDPSRINLWSLWSNYHAAEKWFERFRFFFWNYLPDASSIFVVANNIFERFEFSECSKFKHMQRDCACACAVACLHQHISMSNVVVCLTIHDNIYITKYFRRCCKTWNHCGRSKASLIEHHGKRLTCKSFVILGFWWRKTNRNIQWLMTSAAPADSPHHLEPLAGASSIGTRWSNVSFSQKQNVFWRRENCFH